MPVTRDSFWLFVQAAVIQAVLGAPFGIGAFSSVLAKTGSAVVAWPVAYAFGCYQMVGIPFVLGGVLIGMTRRRGRGLALALVGLPTSLAAGLFMPHVLLGLKHMPVATLTVGGIVALWMLSTMVTMVGFGIGRILAQGRQKELQA